MITVNLNDNHLAENLRAIRELQETGLFTDEQLQEMYNKQLEKDRNRGGATMNELKPEDVMRALDILDKMDFFQGKRAGRELWFEKPFEVQEQDITDFSQGIAFLKNLVKDALALLRDKQASIEMMAECIKRQDKELAKKDAEIESLTKRLEKEAKCQYDLCGQIVDLKSEIVSLTAQIEHCDACDRIGLTHSEHIVCIKQARAEAIDEFAERMEKSLTAQVNVSSQEMLVAFMWCLDLVKNVKKQLKGEKE